MNLNDRFSVGRSGDRFGVAGGEGGVGAFVRLGTGIRLFGGKLGALLRDGPRFLKTESGRGELGIGAEVVRRAFPRRGARGERRTRSEVDACVGGRRFSSFGARTGPVEERFADILGHRGIERVLRGISLGDLNQVCRRPTPNIGSEELVPNCRKERGVDAVRLEEADFHLGRVNVDVDLRGIDLDLQEGDRIPPDHQKPSVRLNQRVLERLVPDVSAV